MLYILISLLIVATTATWMYLRPRRHISSPSDEDAARQTKKKKIVEGNEQQQQQQQEYDIIVVGSGVVGSALVSTLAREPVNKRVLCIERSFEYPNLIIGEFLQPGGVHSIKELGMEECFEGIDSPKTEGYVVYYEGEEAYLPYPSFPQKFGKDLPRGRSFHYGRWVGNLRDHARKQKNVTMLEGVVTTIIESERGVVTGVEYKDKNTGEAKRVYAPLTIIANGTGSLFSKQFTKNYKPSIVSNFAGCHIDDAAHLLPRPNHGHVFLTTGGPVLLYPISSTAVRCLIDFPVKLPSLANGDMQQHIRDKLAPSLPENLRAVFLQTIEDKSNLKVVPCRQLSADPVIKEGALLLGDALNCRHPLTGGGMTVGFGDVVILRDLLKDIKDLNDRAAVKAATAKFFELRKAHHSSTVNILANALYAIFAPRHDPMMPRMRQAVFEYFKLGGICAEGPVGILGGLITNPYVLTAHFFAVAFIHCFRTLFPIPYPSNILVSYRLIKSATFLIGPYILNERILTPGFALHMAKSMISA